MKTNRESLFSGILIGLGVCELLLLVFCVRQSVTDWVAAGLFSLYISKGDKTKTNAIANLADKVKLLPGK